MTDLSYRRDIPLQFRASQRITITVPYSVISRVNELASEQGRSVSNCVAYYLERALDEFA
jgi:hypothetical protein